MHEAACPKGGTEISVGRDWWVDISIDRGLHLPRFS